METALAERRVDPQAAERFAEAVAVGKAVVGAARRLGVSGTELARILGLSKSTISRLGNGSYQLKPESKAFELAVLFIRLYQGLDIIVGGYDESSKSWLRVPNRAFDGRIPCQLIQSAAGLSEAVAYVDSHRAGI